MKFEQFLCPYFKNEGTDWHLWQVWKLFLMPTYQQLLLKHWIVIVQFNFILLVCFPKTEQHLQQQTVTHVTYRSPLLPPNYYWALHYSLFLLPISVNLKDFVSIFGHRLTKRLFQLHLKFWPAVMHTMNTHLQGSWPTVGCSLVEGCMLFIRLINYQHTNETFIYWLKHCKSYYGSGELKTSICAQYQNHYILCIFG